MRNPWDRTRLSVRVWHGPLPDSGDELMTTTGRRYLVVAVRMSRDGQIAALDCLVLPANEPATAGRVFDWTWSPRRSRRALR
jgi:hypothetical protein